MDPNLVNAWGIAITAASPFWACVAGTAMSTVYTARTSTFAISTTKSRSARDLQARGWTRSTSWCPRLPRTAMTLIVQIGGFPSPGGVS